MSGNSCAFRNSWMFSSCLWPLPSTASRNCFFHGQVVCEISRARELCHHLVAGGVYEHFICNLTFGIKKWLNQDEQWTYKQTWVIINSWQFYVVIYFNLNNIIQSITVEYSSCVLPLRQILQTLSHHWDQLLSYCFSYWLNEWTVLLFIILIIIQSFYI